MKILGIDPGSVHTGWGVVVRSGNRLACVEAGVISPNAKWSIERRLKTIYDELCSVIELHAPEQVAVEDVFQAKYAKSALKLGQARGVALVAAAQHTEEVHSYAPSLIKRTIAGSGGADKRQVAQLVGAILGLAELPAVDATDALAIAITHAQAVLVGRSTGPGRRPKR